MIAAAFSAFPGAARAATTVLPRPTASGVAASIILAEATLDDLGHDFVLVAREDLDILHLKSSFAQLVDELLSDLGALDGGDDGCC